VSDTAQFSLSASSSCSVITSLIRDFLNTMHTMNYIVTRPHCSTTWMQPVVTVGVALSVGQSVCLSVTIMSPAKMAEPIEMLFGLWTRVGPMNYVLDGGQ